jgi:non-heme chloroperoxidase
MSMKSLCLIVLCCTVAIVSAAHAGITQGFVAGAGRIEIHYREAGPRYAPHTVLLIPGWRVSSLIWAAQLRYFGGLGDRVIAIDSRSQGGSSVAYAHNSPEDRAEDIRAIIAHLHLSHVTLVGWSQGAQDVSAYVDRFGTGALDELVLVDSPLSSGARGAARSPEFLTIVLRGIALYSRHPRADSRGMMHAIISVPTAPSTIRQLVSESLRTPTDVGISMLVQDLFTVDRRPYLAKFDKPTLVIASGSSPLLEAQKRMAARLTGGRLVIILHAAHAVFFDRPAAFDNALQTFITSVSSHGSIRP